MKYCLVLLFLLPVWCLAQKEGNFWMFGYCNSINFNSGIPVYGGVPGTGNNINTNISFNRANAIADANGQLLFYVKLTEYDTRIPSNASIYDANGNPMANSELATATPIRGPVQIIKQPGSEFIYYVVYSLNYALLATTVDMRLNNGLGGVVATEKGMFLSGWQTVVGEKTVVVQGCDGLWVVVRSRTANQYFSYKVTAAGIQRTPVISECGLLPLSAYHTSGCNFEYGDDGYASMTGVHAKPIGWAGTLRASPDSRKIVAACCGGLELYDFSKCSGKLSDPVLIDTVNTIEVNYTPFCGFRPAHPKVTFHSACFSPDNSKLYATYYLLPYVFQYDLNAPREQIIGTKTRVLTNQPTRTGCRNICMFIDTIGMDDLKLGPDGKIYISNNGHPPCTNTNISNVGHMKDYTLHAINNPNLPGLACNPQHNALVLGPLDGSSKFRNYHTFNPPIVVPPTLPDTLTHSYSRSLCQGDLLQADRNGDCYRWSTGVVDTHAIQVTRSGIYVAYYYKNCAYYIDSFWVAIPPFPEVAALQYGCPEELSIRVKQRYGDTCSYQYTLHHPGGDSSTGKGVDGYVFDGLHAGHYALQVQAAQDCDTIFQVLLESYPSPTLEIHPWDTTIIYGDVVQLQAGGALLYAWSPAGSLNNPAIPVPIARPKESTLYMVIGMNDYGCKDTAYVMVRLDYGLPDMLPNAFSPNGDGLNDVFRLEGITYQQLNFFKVFNRFGQLVFYTSDITKGWDGTYKEQVCDAGTYYYQVELVYPDGRLKRVKGDVVLLR